MAVEMEPQSVVNEIVSHLPGVISAVRRTAEKIGARAEARLAAHRYTGAASVSVTYGKVDAFVNLDDEAAMSIEFGHFLVHYGKQTPVYIPGLYIVTGAAKF